MSLWKQTNAMFLLHKWLFIIEHRKHSECLNWDILLFREKHIWNLMESACLKKLGKVSGTKLKQTNKKTGGGSFCN